MDEKTGELNKCTMYIENSTNVTTSCDYGWTYNNVDGDYTIVNEVIIVTITWTGTIDSFMYCLLGMKSFITEMKQSCDLL